MSERILKALMQLFAIVTVGDGEEKSVGAARDIVRQFLSYLLSKGLVEVYLDLPKNKKLEYAKGMLGHTGKGDEEFTELLSQIISLMKKTH